MPSPRALIISGDFPPFVSGVGDYTDKLAAAIHEAGGDVTVLTTQTQSADDSTRSFRVLRTIVNWSLANRRAVLDECCRGYDVIQLQYPCLTYGKSPLINLLPAMLQLRSKAPPVIMTVHDFRVMRRRWRARVAPMLWAADGLIHVDEQDWPWIRGWGVSEKRPRAHIPIAANAQPVTSSPELRDRWRSELGFAAGETVVAFFGILYPHKGLTELLQAVQELRSNGRQIRLLVLGDFDRQADYRPAMEKMLADPAVKWVQGAPLEEVSRCLHAADFAALPFHSGASTNRGSLLSTLAHGLPTITTNGPCTPIDFDKSYDVLLVPVNDPTAISAAITRLLDEPGLASRMRQSALARHRGWDAVARQTMAFYESLVASKKRVVTA
jgi:glycosyltransferase involved in cell wall biosynthesis